MIVRMRMEYSYPKTSFYIDGRKAHVTNGVLKNFMALISLMFQPKQLFKPDLLFVHRSENGW